MALAPFFGLPGYNSVRKEDVRDILFFISGKATRVG